MSSKPHPEGATDAISLVREMRSLRLEERELRKATCRLRDVLDRKDEVKTELNKLLRGMDVIEGNTGWDGRLSWFVAEIVNQVDDEGTPAT